jgi:DNA-binding response OmpR family regulator
MSKRILIIDDEDDVRELAKLGMEMMNGWEVLTAPSGHEGIIMAIASQPDAILLDVMMPDLDGVGTFAKLQENPDTSSIPVILLTAKAQVADQRRFTKLGVKALFLKPFDPVTLPAQISKILQW